jgi:predicted metal-binding membrane protein
MLARGQSADEGGGPRLGRDRGTVITAVAVIGLGLLAWVAVIADASTMSMPGPATSPNGMSGMAGMPGMAGMEMAPVSPTPSLPSALAFLVSWGVMMAAMMLPSAAPMIALYGAV